MSEIKDISDLELRAQPGLEDMGGKHDEVDDKHRSSVLGECSVRSWFTT